LVLARKLLTDLAADLVRFQMSGTPVNWFCLGDLRLVMPTLGVHCQAIMESRHMDVLEMDAASHTGVAFCQMVSSYRITPEMYLLIASAPGSAPCRSWSAC
jgi:hypothetical protein